MLKKIWKDPVVASVIGTLISSFILLVIAVIYSLITDKSIKDSTLFLWNLDIKLGWTILVLFFLILLVAFLKKIRTNSDNRNDKLEDLFHKKFNKITDENNKVTYRFNAYIDDLDNYPFISDLRIYCENHGNSSLMSQTTGCNKQGCNHFNKGYNHNQIKKEIESSLLEKWDDMKVKANL